MDSIREGVTVKLREAGKGTSARSLTSKVVGTKQVAGDTLVVTKTEGGEVWSVWQSAFFWDSRWDGWTVEVDLSRRYGT